MTEHKEEFDDYAKYLLPTGGVDTKHEEAIVKWYKSLPAEQRNYVDTIIEGCKENGYERGYEDGISDERDWG